MTRLYEITNETGNVTATFIKEDGSTKYDITVELWKNGKSVNVCEKLNAVWHSQYQLQALVIFFSLFYFA